jgi:hypothetical protein
MGPRKSSCDIPSGITNNVFTHLNNQLAHIKKNQKLHQFFNIKKNPNCKNHTIKRKKRQPYIDRKNTL